MIGRLSGTVAAVRLDRVVIDVGGVGFEVALTPKALAALPAAGEPIVLHTHLHVREDGMSLYGFLDEDERDVFRVLLGASGVGPRLALTVLGTFAVDALRRIVATEDAAGLTLVPGVGTRTAQKIILDLKPKLADLEASVLGGAGTAGPLQAALEGLGYGPAEIREVLARTDPDEPLGDQIKRALKELAR